MFLKLFNIQNLTDGFDRHRNKMRKLNQFMIIQWLIFLPLILPLSIVSGALRGIKHASLGLFNQIRNDIFSDLIREDNQDFFA